MAPQTERDYHHAMTKPFTIRQAAATDLMALQALYPAAFPEEDLLPLVRALTWSSADVLSLAAERDGLIGHACLTVCEAGGSDVALLGPVAVAPEAQRQGVGAALIREGLDRMETKGVAAVLVLGDPSYYGRFGFSPEHAITAPHPLPDEWAEAWRSVIFSEEPPSGQLTVPPPWAPKELWGA